MKCLHAYDIKKKQFSSKKTGNELQQNALVCVSSSKHRNLDFCCPP